MSEKRECIRELPVGWYYWRTKADKVSGGGEGQGKPGSIWVKIMDGLETSEEWGLGPYLWSAVIRNYNSM
jgi:hypothetical protein